MLRQQLRVYENEFKKKDELIRKLVDEIKNIPTPNQYQNETSQLAKGTKSATGYADYKRKIRELKAELAIKETEIMNAQRQLRFTKITDLEQRIVVFEIEIQKLNKIIEFENSKKPALKFKEIKKYEGQIQQLQQ